MANFDHALKLDPKAARGLIGRARVLIRRGDFQKAVADCTAAVAIEAREEAFAARGDAYRKLGDYAKAVADYDAAQRSTPTSRKRGCSTRANCGRPAGVQNRTRP